MGVDRPERGEQSRVATIPAETKFWVATGNGDLFIRKTVPKKWGRGRGGVKKMSEGKE